MCAALAADHAVPVHDEPFTVLLLTDAAEERRNAPFQRTVKQEIGADDGNALVRFDLQRQRGFIAG